MAHEHFYVSDKEKYKNILMDNPILHYSGFVCDDPQWRIALHSHPFCELIYICEGEGRYIINGREYSAGKGDLILYNKGVLHEEFSDEENPLKTYFCGMGNVKISSLADDCIVADDASPIISTGIYSNKLEGCIADLVQESSYKLMGYNSICSGILTTILVLICRMRECNADTSENENDKDLQISEEIIEYLKSNYNKNISLSDLSRHFYISKYYLSHIFKNETGFSPINYLMKLKIKEAKQLLSSTETSVTEIAIQIGYEDANYFSQLFKKATGMTPSEWRRKK